jgi:quinoprotein glucose dehydrogenase
VTRGKLGMTLRGLAVLIGLWAAAFLYGGTLLVSAGGSAYYLCAGLWLGGLAAAIWRASRWALCGASLLFLVTSLWTLFESGLDIWAMLPRLGLLALLTATLLVLALKGALGGRPATAAAWGGTAALILLMLAMPVAGLIAASFSSFAPTGLRADFPSARTGAGDDWTDYGGTPDGLRFTRLGQITPENVARLTPVWEYSFGDAEPYNLQIAPLKIGKLVYACNSTNILVALDAVSGKQVWRFDPGADIRRAPFRACRSLGYHSDATRAGPCQARILETTIDARLIAIDALTGLPCRDFGRDGEVSLLEGLGAVPKGYYFVNGGPTIARGRIIVGAAVADNQKWGEPSGVIRAFDVITGQLSWAYDVGAPNRIGAPPTGETYTRATPNSWAQMAYDDKLGLVYVPTGNATPDHYGRQRRPIDDEISSALMALDIETGRRRWVFQTTHHDLWDYDLGSQPVLFDMPTASGPVPAVVQPTKRGELFILDRATGEPVTRVEERRVPVEGAPPGERVSPTQPFSAGMPSLAGAPLREADMWGITPFDQLWCRIRYKRARYSGTLTPPGPTPSIMYPGYAGGMNWGSVSIDPSRRVLVTVTSHLANYMRLVPRAEANRAGAFAMGEGREGMDAMRGIKAQANTPYGVETQSFLSPLQVPCQQPPWARISAIDLATRKLLWSRPLGTSRDTGPMGLRTMLPLPIGVPSLGGVLVTETGLAFVGASNDRRFRAFDTSTGQELWGADLPASGIAPVISYRDAGSGRQFILLAAGGHKPLGARGGDRLVAYALPR